jgi:sulfonate transport system ATP-binding protein
MSSASVSGPSLAPRVRDGVGPLLEVWIEAKRYARHNVLARLALQIRAGEIVSVVGPSGCGKSTLLRIVAGLDRDYQGSVQLHGTPLHGPAEKIGVIFQEPRLLPWLSVAENVGFAAGRSARTDPRVAQLLAEVGLAGTAAQLPKTLSGGMAQRVAIARGLFTKPELLLLDEPFSAVDAITRMRLQALLLKMARAHGSAALLITHDLDEAFYLSDRVILMTPGAQPMLRDYTIGQAHPRDRQDATLARLRAELIAALAV